MKALLIDDHVLYCEGLALFAQHRLPQLRLQIEHSLSKALDRLSDTDAPSVVLLDLGLPDSSGLGSLERLREQAPSVPIVVLSADDRPQTVLGAIERGAAGFIPKSADGSALVEALEAVMDGRVYLPETARMVSNGSTPAPDGGALHGLSPRQLDVLRLLVEGRSNKLIQRELALSESTVKTHLEAIFQRLGVKNRTQAVVAAARLGLRLPAP